MCAETLPGVGSVIGFFGLVCVLACWLVRVSGWVFFTKKYEAQSEQSAVAGASYNCINPFNSLRGKEQYPAILSEALRAREIIEGKC